ncbi:SPFH domain / Band 7 family protein [Synechococcus sp. PCC 7335]|uniref:SPFH domain-containing protein n=1 Tax=Synechococcus sp. (strain ATCC 29403 / PCC 7335) TaxID=91464 RepID=UPI00017ED29A|nr:stomatin-like protein [Synechococcus sp. PCC 7335]EDX85587.1 SPFH domain / Band 7 family protein [Synechococcus sp. PCC 7335]
MVSSILAILSFLIAGYTVSSVRIIKEGNAALVERLGKYNRKLGPGVNIIVPVVESVVLEDSLREQTLDIEPQRAITKDSVNLEVDAIIYWRIYDLERTYYAIEDVEFAMSELVTTTLRSEVGKMDFQSLFSSRDRINRALLRELDQATEPWGLKVNRVEIQKLDPPQNVLDAMQKERAAIYEKNAKISEAQADVESMRLLSEAIANTGNGKEVLHYLLAQRYVAANQKIGESDNSKVLFMDPRALTEGLVDLMNDGDVRIKE